MLDSDEEFSVVLPFPELLVNHHPVSIKLIRSLPKKVLEKCRTTAEYEKIKKLGGGSYGAVYRVRDKLSGEICAMKRICHSYEITDDSFISGVREVISLASLSHRNLVSMKNLVVSPNSVFVSLEECSTDLAKFIDNNVIPLNEPQIKCISWQLFKGLEYLCEKRIVHRDLKASNVLLSRDGEVKIADFGFSKCTAKSECWTPNDIVTLWYRPPEILFKVSKHTNAIDMWSAGCIFGELFLMKPLLPGKTELNQLHLIEELIGPPDETCLSDLGNVLKMRVVQPVKPTKHCLNNLRMTFPWISASAMQILGSLLCYSPENRARARDCLKSRWFQEEPLACEPFQLPLSERYLLKRVTTVCETQSAKRRKCDITI